MIWAGSWEFIIGLWMSNLHLLVKHLHPVSVQKLCWCQVCSGLIAISVSCSTTCQNRRTPQTQLRLMIWNGHCGKYYLKINFSNQSSWAGPGPIHSPASSPISFHTLIKLLAKSSPFSLMSEQLSASVRLWHLTMQCFVKFCLPL